MSSEERRQRTVGFYIQTPHPQNKADQLIRLNNAEEIPKPSSFSEIPDGKSLIVVIQNGPFDAAGYAYSEREFKEFTEDVLDRRKRRYLLMDRTATRMLSGFKPELMQRFGDDLK
jgi:hypothetical protein